MWQTKQFRDSASQNKWIENNKHRYQITVLFVNNGYAVEYKKLIQAY